MRAIEINSKTDKKGNLQVNYQLGRHDAIVRVLILLDEETDPNEEKKWLKEVSTNPAFDFLNDPAEDIYLPTDGQPFND